MGSLGVCWVACVLGFAMWSVPARDVPLFSATSAQLGDRFGAALAAAGDRDGDRVPDVLVGAPRAAVGAPSSGRVLLLSGADAHVLLRWSGDDAYDALGWSLAVLGDLDGDGRSEFGFGAPAGTPSAGSVRVVSGRHGGTLYGVVGKAAGDRFGHALCTLGDVDGDGASDFAVAAPQHDGAGNAAGRVRVVSGADGATLRVHDGGAAFEHFGQALAAVGDLNDDGVDELLVGVPFADDTAFNAGSARLYSGRDGALLLSVHGEQVGEQLGHWVAGVGDVDADGMPDFAVAAPGHDGGALDAGAVFVHSGVDGRRLLSVFGDASGQGWGVVAAAGDVDGDGHADLALGGASATSPDAPGEAGRVWIISGATGARLLDHDGARANAWEGFALTNVGDLDGDGRPELIVGAPGHDDVLDIAGAARSVEPREAGR